MKSDHEPSAIQSQPNSPAADASAQPIRLDYESPARPGKASLDWIHIAKGIGIALVVIGHFKPLESPRWWAEIHHCVYTFHMPLFFVLSGFLYSHGKYSYRELVASKFRRLMFPFFALGLCFFVIKYLAGLKFHLLQPASPHSALLLLLHPIRSFAPLLWFVYALFLIFVIYPPLRRLVRSNANMVLLSVALAYLMLWSLRWSVDGDSVKFGPVDLNWLGAPIDNLFLFCFGVMLREDKVVGRTVMGPSLVLILIPASLFAAVYLSARLSLPMIIEGITWQPRWIWFARQLAGVLGALTVINISQVLAGVSEQSRLRKAAMAVGFYSMTIYLFHPIFESGVRIGFLQGLRRAPLHWDVSAFLNQAGGPALLQSVTFVTIALTAVAAGIIFPLLLEKYVLRKTWLTRKFLLGMD